MSRRYLLSIIEPCGAGELDIGGRLAVHVEHQFTIAVAAPLEWVRKHADELAERVAADHMGGRAYCALNIKELRA
jgi:hypothetical protein